MYTLFLIWWHRKENFNVALYCFGFFSYICFCMTWFEQKHPQTGEELSAVRLMTKALQWSSSTLKPFNHPPHDPFFHPFDRRPSKSLAVSSSLLFLLSFLPLPFLVFIQLSSFLPLPSKSISYRANLWQMRTPRERMRAFCNCKVLYSTFSQKWNETGKSYIHVI